MSHIEISACTTPNGDYHVCLEVYQPNSVMNLNIRMTRDELKEMRNSFHNVLIDLNMELNYEQ